MKWLEVCIHQWKGNNSLKLNQKFNSEKKQKYLGKPITTIWFDILNSHIEEIKEEGNNVKQFTHE